MTTNETYHLSMIPLQQIIEYCCCSAAPGQLSLSFIAIEQPELWVIGSHPYNRIYFGISCNTSRLLIK